MNLFEDREKAFEAKFHLDQETEFKIEMRRDKLLGLWAAEQMGMAGDQASAYARSVVEAAIDSRGGETPTAKVLADLQAHDVDFDPPRLAKQMATLHVLAREQIVAEQSGR
ncbi:MAG: DUF1476 domain-containing protein [Magnetospirillum sp.]|nr:DUF1476 domain-containing protein [Magnetospirillum sp.]